MSDETEHAVEICNLFLKQAKSRDQKEISMDKAIAEIVRLASLNRFGDVIEVKKDSIVVRFEGPNGHEDRELDKYELGELIAEIKAGTRLVATTNFEIHDPDAGLSDQEVKERIERINERAWKTAEDEIRHLRSMSADQQKISD